MNNDVDVVVIGGGPGGTPAAMQLASRGKRVLLVEKSGKLGGACLFVGCIPSKIIRHAADEYALALQTTLLKLPSLDGTGAVWEKVRDKMDRILTLRSNAALQHIRKFPDLSFSPGTARFVSAQEVEIEDGAGERSSFRFKNAIVSTGSLPQVPAFRGSGAGDVLTSDTIFGLETLPRSIIVIGGGPVGVELAQMLAKLNVTCTVVEIAETILWGIVEPEFAARLTEGFVKSGIAVYAAAEVLEINRVNGGLQALVADSKGNRRSLQAETVLVATGRVPNIEALNLDAADIRHDRHGVVADGFLQTSAAGVYAAGDVTGGPKFAHTATYEAHIAAANILEGNVRVTDYGKNSWVLFSDPEIASVGYTEAAAVARGYDVLTANYDYKIDATAQINDSPYGNLKFVVDRKTSEIIGVHIFTRGAASLIGEASLIVSGKLTVRDVARAVHPHPTLTEAFGFLALDMLGRL